MLSKILGQRGSMHYFLGMFFLRNVLMLSCVLLALIYAVFNGVKQDMSVVIFSALGLFLLESLVIGGCLYVLIHQGENKLHTWWFRALMCVFLIGSLSLFVGLVLFLGKDGWLIIIFVPFMVPETIVLVLSGILLKYSLLDVSE